MKAIKEHGETIINYRDKSFFFRPSFKAMDDLGSPDDIVQKFADIHDDSTVRLIQALHQNCGSLPSWSLDYFSKYGTIRTALLAAMDVMTVCCDEDITPLIGEIRPSKRGDRLWVWNKGAMRHEEIVIIASNLIQHGIIGKAKVRVPIRNEPAKKTTNKFRAVEYINAARTHFCISRAEAESLTMTEFQLMLNAKYPPQEGLTRDEFESVKDSAKRLRQARIEAEKIKNGRV